MNPTFFLAIALGLSAAPESALTVKEPVADRGAVKAGQPLSHTFELTNTSRKPMRIDDITSACGCLQPRIAKRALMPGESAALDVSINTLSQPAGPHTWATTVHFSIDGEKHTSELKVGATIVREITIEPVALALTLDKGATHTITVIDGRAKPLTIVEARTTSPELKAQLGVRGGSSEGRSRQPVYVTVTDAYPTGRRTETLQLLTDDEDYRELRVPITIDRRVADQVAALPDRVELRLAKGQTAANGLVQLRDAGGKAVVVDRIEADDPAIRFRWAAGPGPMATLRLGVEVSADAPTGAGVVSVHLKEPREQVLKVPVSWQR